VSKGRRSSLALRLIRWLAQGALIVLLGLLLLEGGLRVVALAGEARLSRAGSVDLSEGVLRILNVGDSHAYGAQVGLIDTYPRRVEAGLRERYPEREFQVINLGRPGVNTAFVAKRLEAQILELSPQMVIVWVGINNSWNWAESDPWEGMGAREVLQRALLHLRIYRVARVAWETRHGPVYEGYERPAGRLENYPGKPAAYEIREEPLDDLCRRGITLDYARMAATARAFDIPILFLNYPYSFSPLLRQTILEAAAQAGAPAHDTLKDFSRAKADGHKVLFVSGAGLHPNGTLNRYIAESVLEHVVKLLGFGEA
jgi:hypothetical protein